MSNKKEKKFVGETAPAYEAVEQALAVPTPKKELVLEGDPEQQLAFAMKAADALMKAVQQKPKPVMIRGEQYLEYGDWQTLARFFGATASVAWTKPLFNQKGDAIRGYEARAEVLHNGVVISAAEAMCLRAERNWSDRDEFMLRSMAQTRASAKALRNAYGWVAELAGMKATPAEEMGDLYDRSPVHAEATVVVSGTDTDTAKPLEKPWHKPKATGVALLKKEIQKLCDDKAIAPLLGKKDYIDYVQGNTGLDLTDQSVENLSAIKERLTAL